MGSLRPRGGGERRRSATSPKGQASGATFPSGAGSRAGTPPREPVLRSQKHRLPVNPRRFWERGRPAAPAPQPAGAQTCRLLKPNILPKVADHRDPRAPICLSTTRPLDTHTYSRTLLLHQASEAPATEPTDAPAAPLSFGSEGPLRTRSPPGTAAAAARAQARSTAVALSFFFPLRSAFLNNLALFEHTRVSNGHRGKRLYCKRMEEDQSPEEFIRCTGRCCD